MRTHLLNLLIVLMIAGCGGGAGLSGDTGFIPTNPGDTPAAPGDNEPVVQPGPESGMSLDVLRDASGAPTGVRVTWTKSTAATIDGYWIYRNTTAFPSGDPADFTDYQTYRVTAALIDHDDGAGTTQYHDDTDNFTPVIGTTYYYVITAVNTTADESDFSTNQSITITQHAVTSLTPKTGSIGDSIVVNGTHFGATEEAGDTVYFTDSDSNTTVVANVTNWTDTAITVDVPYGAADGDVAVKIDGNTSDTPAGEEFDYNEPALTDVSPNKDWVQHSNVTITGTDFGPAPGSGGTSSYVYFGDTVAQSGDITSWTTTQIEVKVPAAADMNDATVKVDVAGNVSGTLGFTVMPHVDSLSSNDGNTGDSITLTGTNFGATQGTGSVTVNGVNATVGSWSNTSVSITIPSDATDGDIVLTRSDAEAAEAVGFDVIPTISGLTPARRVVGENLTINGSGFGTSQGSSTVTFNGGGGTIATDYVSWAVGQIVVEVPVGASTGTITVDIDDNNVGTDQDSATSSGNVAIILAAPDITDLGQL
jgi:hypothetical protein